MSDGRAGFAPGTYWKGLHRLGEEQSRSQPVASKGLASPGAASRCLFWCGRASPDVARLGWLAAWWVVASYCEARTCGDGCGEAELSRDSYGGIGLGKNWCALVGPGEFLVWRGRTWRGEDWSG